MTPRSNHAMERRAGRPAAEFIVMSYFVIRDRTRRRHTRIATATRLRAGPSSLILFSLGRLEHFQHEQEGIHDNEHKPRY